MKRILSLLLCLVLVASFFSCTEYEPVKSTKDEERVIMTLSIEGEEYQVRYELYRALFLTYKSEVDGGDATVWSGEKKAEYINKINELIIDDTANIFGVMHLCETVVDYDLYSSDANNLVEQMVKENVEGGDDTIGTGTYEAYLAFLKEQNLNYSVQDLLCRYYIALEKIDEYYVGDTATDSVTEEDSAVFPKEESSFQTVREFYYSDNFARIFLVNFALSTPKDLGTFRDRMVTAAASGKTAVLNVAKPESIWEDIFVAKHTYNSDFEQLSERMFTLPEGTVSELIKIDTTDDPVLDGYYILYSIEKGEEDFIENYLDIKLAYISEKLGTKLTANKNTLKASVAYTPTYGTLVHSDISMI